MKTNNTEQLTLNFDNVDNYARGKSLNQVALQTGAPKGTFNRGDPHPDVEGVLFYGFCIHRANPEKWTEAGHLKELINRQKKRAEIKRRASGVKEKKIIKQTNSIKGTFKRGDKHPLQEGLYFYSYFKGKEEWCSLDKLEERKAKKREYHHKNKKIIKERRRRYLTTETGRAKKRISHRHYASKRRARIRKCNVHLTKEEEGVIKQIHAHAARLSEKLKIPFHVDHIIPIATGGLHHPLNLQVAPARWNESKGARNTERWLPNGL